MQNVKFHLPKLHIRLTQLPQLTLLGLLVVCVLALVGLGWYTWQDLYQPYTQTTVSQDKLTKKLEKLNVADFNVVRDKATAKTKGAIEPSSIHPFGPTP